MTDASLPLFEQRQENKVSDIAIRAHGNATYGAKSKRKKAAEWHLPDSASMGEHREHVKKHMDAGLRCPCCGQFVKMYKRKLTSTMASQLIYFAKISQYTDNEWLHYRRILPKSSVISDFSKLRFWGFIEAKEKRTKSDNSNGFWRITQRGYDFTMCRMSVKKYAKIYNDELCGFDGEEINIKQALGHKFDYQELMSNKEEEA